jgi:RNA polymerase sigma-70 factor (ECF subfamily)
MTAKVTVASQVDELLIALADDAAFEVWYRRTVPQVYAYLLARCGESETAEELTQETYLAAIRQRARFDGRAETVVWLCGIARHKLADHFRARDRAERRRMRLEVRALADHGPHPDEGDVSDRLAIAEALATLPPLQRAVLSFVALDDLPVAEAARLIGKSHGATQSLLARARDGFRRAYGSEAPR